MTKYFYFRKGLLVASLVFAVTFMMAVSIRADMVPTVLDKTGGSHTSSFATPGGWIAGNGFTYSETFTLKDPKWFFTSFVINPKEVNMFVQDVITNGYSSKPEIVLDDTYAGLAKWSGEVVIKSGDDVLYTSGVNHFSKTIDGITYTSNLIEGGTPGYAESEEYNVNFSELLGLGVNLGADTLAGAREIVFDLILSNTSFDNTDFDHLAQAGNSEYWEGSIGGSMSMTYDTSSSSPEPATMLIFGLGIAGAGVVAQRKRKGKK